MHKTLEMLSTRLCRDIEESVHEDKITPATMEMLDKAVDIIKDIETIKAMEDYGEDDNYKRRYMSSDYRGDYHNDYRGNYRENKERMSDHEIDQIRRIVNQM